MKLTAGDIFSIDLGEEKVGFGQIILKPKYKLFIIVFEEVYQKDCLPKTENIPKPVPLLMGYTLDGLLYHGDWKVIGNHKGNIADYPFPFYKVGTPPDVFLVNHKGEKIRKATGPEIDVLSYETTLAPIYYEDALKAWHKIVPWEKSFDEILYKNVLRQIFSVTL